MQPNQEVKHKQPSPTSMDCRTQLASLATEEVAQGDYLMATKILTTGIRLEPNNHELYFERSICHHKLGDFKSSLDDANTAIRLNPADFNIHFQKGLALIGLSTFSEAVTSFKKAIELRAKLDNTKLSDIFKLLRDATNELNTARRPPGLNNHQARTSAESVPIPTRNPAGTVLTTGQGTKNDPVDSTTDRPLTQPGTSSFNHQNMTFSSSSVESLTKNGNNNLVAANRNNNNQPISNSSQVINGNIATNRVSSSASHINNHHMPSINISPDMTGINVDRAPQTLGTDLSGGEGGSPLNQHIDQSKAAQFEWNIRRSERIFLHHSNEPGAASGPQYGILTRHNESPSSIYGTQRQKTGSNPSSVHSGRSATKRSYDHSETLQQATYQSKVARSKDGTSSHAESEIDVDDTNYNSQTVLGSNTNEPTNNRKRVMIAPSSSMPATSQQGPSTSTSKDDSYSSKYKRLRRDRERARRGTSKLCTIRPSDLEELHKSSNSDGSKRYMRVIAPIDGWLYSGQLCIDDSNGKNGAQQYVVRLDGDATGSSYLFNQDTVLNDVIKEVRVKSVSELRKGARICCYWSRQYKCLSTGVVTSRTFEATKSLVSVKYDNGDLSALPLDDLRLLPPDYPKYMSNCDPLLLARNGDGVHVTSAMPIIGQPDSNRIIVECKQTNSEILSSDGVPIKSDACDRVDVVVSMDGEPSESVTPDEATRVTKSDDEAEDRIEQHADDDEEVVEDEEIIDEEEVDDDTTIPPTDEVIECITSESTLKMQDANQHDFADRVECISITKDNITITNETQMNTSNSRASSEENNYGIEYCPWMFDGPPKRTKRHGRTYRDNYPRIRRGNEIIRVGDSAELMPRDESILPFIARIEGLWATSRGEMRVKVRWYYRLVETEGEPFELKDGENALFETDHCDENDVQSIYRSTKILPWTDYCKNNLGHVNTNNDNSPKIFYLAGYYDPVRRIKQLRSDVKEAQ